VGAHIKPLSESDARSADPRLEELVAFVGYRPNALLTMAIKPGLLPAVLQLVSTTIRGEGLLSEALRFLVACEASRGARCIYSATHAVHAAFHAGVSWEKLAALDDAANSPLYTPAERAALGLATAGAPLPVAAGGAAFELAANFYSEPQLLEIVSVIALFGWFNRWNGLMGSELEDVPSEALQHVPWLVAMERKVQPPAGCFPAAS
jgi:alkylhydroperoxidase family enzyme